MNNTVQKHDRVCKFTISPYYIQSGSTDIIERSILRAMQGLYDNGVLTSEPVDVRVITEAEYDESIGELSDSPMDAVKIYFRDKE
ncbi:hypothetical protein DESC_470001 [Desulfosarcina cetonica]|nr:hypothetical protein DESC_470001 [Desulfosarcina cetonica]